MYNLRYRAAVRNLGQALAGNDFRFLTGNDNAVVTVSGQSWWIVYRSGDDNPSAVWDFYPDSKDPGPGRHLVRVTDRLLTFEELFTELRALRGDVLREGGGEDAVV